MTQTREGTQEGMKLLQQMVQEHETENERHGISMQK